MQYLLIPSKMEDAPQLLKIPKVRKSRYLDTSTETHRPKSWSTMKDPVVPLERNLYGHPLAGLLWERQFEKVLLKYGWEKFQIGNVCSLTEKKGLFLSVYVDDIKLAGKKQNIHPNWRIFMKDVDLGEPTSLFDHVYLGCTQRECQTSKDIVDNHRSMSESRISAGATENFST